MADMDASMKLTSTEIDAAFADPHWAAKFPPIMTIQQAAELLQIPVATLYDWRSRGVLTGSCRKVGKHLRFFRNRLVQRVMNEGIS